MSLKEQIQQDQKTAMKEKQQEQLETLRGVWAVIRKEEIDSQKELDDEGVQAVIARQVKQLQDAKTDFLAGGRSDLSEKADREMLLLSRYLPAQMSDEELDAAIQAVLGELGDAAKNVGMVMGAVMKVVKGKADGNRVRERVSQMMNG